MSIQSENLRSNNPGAVLDRYLREPEVLRLTGISQMTLHRWEKRGHFPKRYKIGPNSVAWKESEVSQWLATREFAIIGSSKKGAL